MVRVTTVYISKFRSCIRTQVDGCAHHLWRRACSFFRLSDNDNAGPLSGPHRDLPTAVQRHLHVLRCPAGRRLSRDARHQRRYASSYLSAVPGSPHGYDVADPTRLNPEIGSDEEYWEWIARSRPAAWDTCWTWCRTTWASRKLGESVVDGRAGERPDSRFAHFFDIAWRPVKDELADKVLIPMLGDQYGAVLDRQELQLAYRDGAFIVRYYDERLPIAPDTFGRILTPALDAWLAAKAAGRRRRSRRAAEHHRPQPATCRRAATAMPESIATRAREKEIVKRRLAALVERCRRARTSTDSVGLLQRRRRPAAQLRPARSRCSIEQSYRLAHWRVASEEINYRRFFDVNQLAALRMEDPAVFDEVHRFAFELIRRGAATGLRVDHVDGLLRARRLPAAPAGARGASPRPPAATANALLCRGRKDPRRRTSSCRPTGRSTARPATNSPRSSTACSSTGATSARSTDIYERFVRERRDAARRSTISSTAARSRSARDDVGRHQLARPPAQSLFRAQPAFPRFHALQPDLDAQGSHRLLSRLPDLRHASTSRSPSTTAATSPRRSSGAKRRAPATHRPGVRFHRAAAAAARRRSATPEECEERARFIGKFQQITSPVAAKGIEDTALYVYNRLLSLNEVGSDPTRFGLDPAAVHDWLADRQQPLAAALSATSTHDTKRGEDVRARLNVLSEMPGAGRRPSRSGAR